MPVEGELLPTQGITLELIQQVRDVRTMKSGSIGTDDDLLESAAERATEGRLARHQKFRAGSPENYRSNLPSVR